MALEIYKKGQGFYTRIGTAAGTMALAAWMFVALSNKLQVLQIENPATRNAVIWGVPIAILAMLAWVVYWVLNKPTIADFMIATEGEMKKVSWSSRKEIIASTKIVIVVVLIMAVLLAAVDLGFSSFFKLVGVLRI